MKLSDLLKNWGDQDVSAYYLACCLDLIEFDESFAEFRKSKYIFWTKNQTSDFLYQKLHQMFELNVLEFNEDEGKYRWNQSFKV